ncbi:MAG: hypothetical protein KF841_07595 [Phycisphaerae bacterium]|nr:hypothetical protein [Phycisphaerae bacterium]
MFLELCFLVAVISAAGPVDVVPESLARAYSRRMDFTTAYFDYEYQAEVAGGRRIAKRRYEARFAGDTVFWVDHGDEDGIVAYPDYNAGPRFGVRFTCSPMRIVRVNGGQDEWGIQDGGTTLIGRRKFKYPDDIIGPGPNMLLDPRCAGLWTRAYSEKSPSQWLADLQGRNYQWSERNVDGIVEVVGSIKAEPDSKSSFPVVAWRIDPARDHAIVDIKTFVRGRDGSRELHEHLEAEHKRVNGRWWPVRCVTEFAKGGGETIVFNRVEFDRKEHPSELGPDILGVPPGLPAVDRIHHDPSAGPLAMGRYIGGGTVVSGAEWAEVYHNQFDAGELADFMERARVFGNGEYPRWWSADDETFGLKNVSHMPDMWEAYVRRWIIRHSHDAIAVGGGTAAARLKDSQIESAMAILKDCRKSANLILRRRDEESAVETSSPHETATAANPGDRYERELDKIFQTLKIRLNGLLTTKQQKSDAGEAALSGAGK